MATSGRQPQLPTKISLVPLSGAKRRFDQKGFSSLRSANCGRFGFRELCLNWRYVQETARELAMQEAIALEWWFGTNLAVFENNLLQFHSGFLTPEHWQRNLKELECMLTVPLFRQIATDWPFRESFQKVISEELQKIPADSENCWSYSYGWDFPIR